MQILHDSQNSIYRDPVGAAKVGSSVKLAIRAFPAQSVVLRTWQDGVGERFYPMQRDGEFFRWELKLPECAGLLWYYFIVTEESGHRFCYGNNPDNLGGIGCGYGEEPPSYQITIYEHADTPEWFKKAIYYQIFPDRFYCDKKSPGLTEWGKPPVYDKNPDGSIRHWDFYGGTLNGIKEKLPYLSMLGVSAVYLNPIFKAVSNHRYDTSDYMHVDPLLGTDEDFKSLCRAAAELDINIILDGVFSHNGINSIYYKEHPEWYKRNADGSIKCWWGVKDLPEVEELTPSYLDFICGSDGVIRHWLRMGAMGFRLDVADELPDEFIKNVRRCLKDENPDAVLIGEVWEDASNKFSHGEQRRYFMGRELDSVMNYPLRSAVIDYVLGNFDAELLARRILSLKENYPKENFDACLNILGSHDRERILTVFGFGAGGAADCRACSRLKEAAALVYALPGVPGIYYGDEAGLTGGADPQNRACYPWGSENGDILYTYRMLGCIYKEHTALATGSFEIIKGSELFAFVRRGGGETILVVCNNSSAEKHFTMPRELCGYSYALELIRSQEYNAGDIIVPAESTFYLLLSKDSPGNARLERKAGVICALSSLSDPYRFIDFLSESGFGIWQLLPINPRGLGNSPYLSDCVFAIDPEYADKNDTPSMDGYNDFKKQNSFWLDNYASFAEKKYGKSAEEIKKEQYYCEQSWKKLKAYANSKGILLFGDIPIYTSLDGADVLAAPSEFQIDNTGRLKARSGVPPDYFQKNGQDWGNPLYNWKNMKKNGYDWWKKRIDQCLSRFDYVRLDHFRSFSEYYSIPAGKPASEGYWQKGPGMDFLNSLGEQKKRIIAEDLGMLDSGVFNLLKQSGIPGMNVWQFSADEMLAMPKKEAENRVFYSGTHDNNTLLGWLRERNEGAEEAEVCDILEKLWKSDAPWVIVQLQDVLMLGEEARMNVPGVPEGNWSWHLDPALLTPRVCEFFKNLSEKYNR